jgi:peroxiredoxin
MALSFDGLTPDFTLPDLEGNQWRLSGLRGRKVLIYAWASW